MESWGALFRGGGLMVIWKSLAALPGINVSSLGPPLCLLDSYLLGSLPFPIRTSTPPAFTSGSLPNRTSLLCVFPCVSLHLSMKPSLLPLAQYAPKQRSVGLRKAQAAPELLLSILSTLTWLDVQCGLVRSEWQNCRHPCQRAYCLHVQEAPGDIDVVENVRVQVMVPITEGSEGKRIWDFLALFTRPPGTLGYAFLPVSFPSPARCHGWPAPQPISPRGPWLTLTGCREVQRTEAWCSPSKTRPPWQCTTSC